MKNNLVKLIITVGVIAMGVGFLIYSSVGDTEYYKMVHEVMGEPENWEGRTLRVHGYVEAGSIEEAIVDQKTTRTFILENQGKRIRVKHEGPKPDTFKDQSEVVAKGRLVRIGEEFVLEATELMAKCPSKYEGAGTNKDLNKDQGPF